MDLLYKLIGTVFLLLLTTVRMDIVNEYESADGVNEGNGSTSDNSAHDPPAGNNVDITKQYVNLREFLLHFFFLFLFVCQIISLCVNFNNFNNFLILKYCLLLFHPLYL